MILVVIEASGVPLRRDSGNTWDYGLPLTTNLASDNWKVRSGRNRRVGGANELFSIE